MFYVLAPAPTTSERAITSSAAGAALRPELAEDAVDMVGYDGEDIDIVDDALLNTAPHNKIERQLLTGDVVGLALMSSAIIWSAMGAFG